jgi:hypothetical protein
MPEGDEPYYLIKDFTMGLIYYFDIFYLAMFSNIIIYKISSFIP